MTTRHNLERALHAAQAGALVLTSNTRAARNFRREFADRQRAAGHEVWKSPEILPWSAWLRKLWQRQIYLAVSPASLLDEAQERIVWEHIIRGESASLDAVSLAAHCGRAWRLLHSFRIPRERAIFAQGKDNAAFFRWMAAYSNHSNANGWMDEARLSDAIVGTARGECAGRKMLLWGFDRFTPQQMDLISALQAAGVECESLQPDGEATAARRLSLDDTQAELRAAARWARTILDKEPKTTIGVVVPNLGEIRSAVERVFFEVLHPQALTIEGADQRRAFDISLGLPVAKAPVVGAALMLLEIAAGPVSLEKISRLLRSPFVGETDELGARCLLDAEVRAKRLTELSLEALEEWTRGKFGSSRFASALRKFKEAVARLPRTQMASRWSRDVVALLRTAGWPGSRTESSPEHQARQAFADLLGKFAKFDVVFEAMDFPTMVRRLIALSQETLFQPENLGSPIQVVGVLEAAGSHFDHVWMIGLHADAWPPAPNPSPFLPVDLQVKLGTTGASSEERLEYARLVMDRLQCSAPDVVFSSPLRQGDQELSVSPLIEKLPELDPASLHLGTSTSTGEVLFASRYVEESADEFGPELEDPRSKGGTRILRLQAACPFRAFAELRLNAKELEMPAPGIDRRLRGGLLHQALNFVWSELQSQEALRAKSKAEVLDIVGRGVDRALNESDAAALTGWEREVAELERHRLTQIILDLLAMEAERQTPFHIFELEQKKEVELGGVVADVKVDRIDRLDDGRYVLLDYKSGEPKLSSWDGERPDEPQLPIYATQLKDGLAAVAFVQMTKGDLRFRGYAKNDRLLPDIKAFASMTDSQRPAPTWHEMLADWEEKLHRLGRSYKQGEAAVDPKKPSTCDLCHLSMMCRIDEEPLVMEDEDE